MKENEFLCEQEARNEMKFNWNNYNHFKEGNWEESSETVFCPVIRKKCKTWQCASWQNSKVEMIKQGADTSMNTEFKWKIVNGYCRNPFITGKIL